jgi:hypothetical protein
VPRYSSTTIARWMCRDCIVMRRSAAGHRGRHEKHFAQNLSFLHRVARSAASATDGVSAGCLVDRRRVLLAPLAEIHRSRSLMWTIPDILSSVS